LAIVILGIGALFAINGTSSYDASKYSLTVTPDSKPFGVDSSIEFTLPDQFSKAHTLPADTKKLMFVFTKDTGHIFKSFMAYQKESYLTNNKIVAVADISGMPTVIYNTFALPDFQKSSYSVLLIHDKEMAKKLKEGQDATKVIVMTLDSGKVVKIALAADSAELGELLK